MENKELWKSIASRFDRNLWEYFRIEGRDQYYTFTLVVHAVMMKGCENNGRM